jgi:hypothetical protein
MGKIVKVETREEELARLIKEQQTDEAFDAAHSFAIETEDEVDDEEFVEELDFEDTRARVPNWTTSPDWNDMLEDDYSEDSYP